MIKSGYIDPLISKCWQLFCACLILGRVTRQRSSAPIGCAHEQLIGCAHKHLKVFPFDVYALPRGHKTCVTRTMTTSSLTVGVLKYTGSYKIKLNVDFECDQTMTPCFLAVDYKICSSCVRSGLWLSVPLQSKMELFWTETYSSWYPSIVTKIL